MILGSVRARFAACSALAFFATVIFLTRHPYRLYSGSRLKSDAAGVNHKTSTPTPITDAPRQNPDAPGVHPKATTPTPITDAPRQNPDAPGVHYKTSTHTFPYTAYPIIEHFPRAASAKSSKDLPAIPKWNTPPPVHVEEVTPLFIGFTRNWPLLQQVVVGYLTAGWPPEDIYVVENTGTMFSNAQALLNESNPFYLDHRRLKDFFGVNLIITPALLTFAQLQNLYLYESIRNNWTHYFWSHMDVVPQSWEDREPYKSLYMRAVDIVRQCYAPGYAKDADGRENRWALRFLSYDWLTLMNTATMIELGGWDNMIGYYGTDCDMYDRMRMAGLSTNTGDAGKIWDVGESLPDLEVLYNGNAVRNGTGWHQLQAKLKSMQHEKVHGELHRNSWQSQQHGGEGQPFYRDMAGFEEALEITIKAGEAVCRSKWGTSRCDIKAAGLKLGDEWKVEKVVE